MEAIAYRETLRGQIDVVCCRREGKKYDLPVAFYIRDYLIRPSSDNTFKVET